VWDLTPDLHTLEHGLARDHKLRLRKWWKTNVETVVDDEHLPERFASLYTDFAQRAGVGSAYQMTPEVLRAVAADAGVLAVGAREAEGPICAVSLFPHAGTRADYYLNGAAPQGRHHARGLVWTAMTVLRARGVEAINLGGGVSAGDSLDSFKRRFGARAVQTQVLRQIIHPVAYARACEHRGVDPTDTAGYFPAYRTP
jgi:hypothetical protein